MRLPLALLLPVLLFPVAGCRQRRTQGPDWVATTPPGTLMAFSGQVGWILDRPDFQALLRNYPMAEQSLELFLKKARIAPKKETGRVSLFVLSERKPKGKKAEMPQFLLQFGGFQEPSALQTTLVESFPSEGTLSLGGREVPLHVILDVNQWHIRACADDQGRIWLGDLASLSSLSRSPRAPLALVSAAQWIDSGAPLQGVLQPGPLLEAAQSKAGGAGLDLPQGLDGLAWSVHPIQSSKETYRIALCITGSREGIRQATPWLQRLVALTGGTQAAPSQAEMVEEPERIGVRAQVEGKHLEGILGRLAGTSVFRFPGSPPPSKSVPPES